MASLLSLPVELQDRIIELVLLGVTRTPPASVASARRNRWTDKEMPSQAIPGFHSWAYGPKHVRYERELGTNANVTGLLRANRALNRQTKDAVARLWPGGVEYRLDVMVVDERELWPTWLHVPVVAKRLGAVHITIRDFDSGSEGKGLTKGPGEIIDLVWCFYYLLERFFRCGLGRLAHPAKGQPYRGDCILAIGNITMDFCGGDPRPGLCVQHDGEGPVLCRGEDVQPDDDYVAYDTHRRAWLADFVDSYLQSLARMCCDHAKYGLLLYERVGTIDAKIQAAQSWVVLLGDELARMEFRPTKDLE